MEYVIKGSVKDFLKKNQKTVADIFDDYAKYLYIVLKKEKSAIKYYSKAEKIFEGLDLKNAAQTVREKIKKINEKH